MSSTRLQHLTAKLKPWMLPIAMATGLIAHDHIGLLTPLAPYLIFAMLFITFCKIDPRGFRVTPVCAWLLAIQIGGAAALYTLLRPIDALVAQGVFVCVFCPTATAAPVITGMLGGSVEMLVTYSIISNGAVALTAPLLFPLIAGNGGPGFAESLAMIASKIGPLLLAPLLLAFASRRLTPSVNRYFARHGEISFYIWAVSLILVVGSSVSFAMSEPPELIPTMIILAIAAGAACVAQFAAGRLLGRLYGDRIAGAQGLGQKNTVLAVWMALSWLNPVTSIAPAAYVAWQNTINSLQLYLKERKHDGR